jgi:membrane-associated phospholipid phosphatase
MPRKLIIEHRYFVYVLLGAVSFIFYRQGSETLFFDGHHTPFFNFFFVLMTRLAEGPFLLLLALILLFVRMKYFLVYLIDLSIVAIIIGFLKYRMFADHIRPSLFFGQSYKLHFVEGVPILTHNSFPSGHTAVAFAVFFLLAIFIKRTSVSMVLLCLALLVGLSRIYLMEHFWIDVYFGSVIGMLITFFVYIALQNRLIHRDSRFLNLSLYKRYIKKH